MGQSKGFVGPVWFEEAEASPDRSYRAGRSGRKNLLGKGVSQGGQKV
jgi:hypothetical protein